MVKPKKGKPKKTSSRRRLRGARTQILKAGIAVAGRNATSVNAQLRKKLTWERKIANDLKNILGSLNIAALFFDRNFKLRDFTSGAAARFNLNPADIGRSLADLAGRFTDVDLLADARIVLTSLTPIRREVKS